MKTKNLVVGMFVFLLTFIMGCSPDEKPESKLEVRTLVGVTPAQDYNGKQVEEVTYYQDDRIDVAFSVETVENGVGMDKWREVINTFNDSLGTQFNMLYAVTETFSAEDEINIGSQFTLEVNPEDFIRTYITKNDVPSNYRSSYGDSFVNRVVDGGLIEFIDEDKFEIIYELPFNLDAITMKYLNIDNTLVGNQAEAGIESTFYSELDYKIFENDEHRLVKVRNERINLIVLPTEVTMLETYASLGKTYVLETPSIFTDGVAVRADMELDVFMRTFAYELGQEDAITEPVDWEFLRTRY